VEKKGGGKGRMEGCAGGGQGWKRAAAPLMMIMMMTTTACLKYFTYQLVPTLDPNISSTFCRRLRLKSAFFLCRKTPTNKIEVTILSQLILFPYYYADERNYYTLGFIFIYGANIPCRFPSRIVTSARQRF
jgi:hypothetical protein